jgi:hypothetical protein
MNDQAAKQRILSSLLLGRPDITSAKAFLMQDWVDDEHRTSTLAHRWIRSLGIETRSIVILRANCADDDLRLAGRELGLKLAFHYAVWELVGSGALMPGGSNSEEEPTVPYTTITDQSGGVRGGLYFPELKFTYPERIYKPANCQPRSLLSDGDLYLRSIGLDLHPGIEEALQEAARCFRHDLYTAALAMLGAASEGVWSETGAALALECSDSAKALQVSRALTSGTSGIGLLMNRIRELCEDPIQSGDILAKCGVSLADLRAAWTWSDTIRDARNVLHWGVQPALANGFDKVSALMLAAAHHLKTLWTIRTAAIEAKQKV